ncbi:unnamed protein product, partial [marine sediment metagenome]
GQKFELAAFWRDKLEDIDHATDRQHVLMSHEENKDIVGFFNNEKYMAMVIIHIRESRIINKSSFTFDLREKLIQKKEILNSILEQYYQNFKSQLPDIVIIPEMNKRFRILYAFLKDINEEIQLKTPSSENEISLLRIANKNAKVMVEQQVQMEEIKMNDAEFREKLLKESIIPNYISDIIEKYKNLYNELLQNSKKRIAEIGARRFPSSGQKFNVMTHCHSSLVTGILLEAKRQGKDFKVINTETQPRLQGRKTAKKLLNANIEVIHVVDSAMRWAVRHYQVNMIIIGADSITSEGTIINKIG